MTDWSRRQVLGATAGWALAAAAAACAGDEGEPTGASAPGAPITPVATPPASPVVSPVTTPATVSGVSGSLNDVEHVVIFFQENRSFDHYFGTRPGSRGFGDAAAGAGADSVWYQPYEGSSDGYLLPYRLDTASTSGACGPDPDHTWAGQHAAWNGGRNDGFGRTMGSSALGYFARADLPFYSALADEFTLCDQYFCSVIGPTTPNRLYSLSATIDPGGAGGGPVIDNLTGPFAWTTYPERLQKAGVSWRVYHEADDYDDNPLKFFTAFQNLETSDPLFDAAIRNRPADAFVNDVLAGDLPQVSWIVAPTVVSEHPPFPPAVGEDMSATILAALMSKPEVWAKTVFILSYDENGGYFDHVVPPTPSAGTVGEFVGELPIGLGFRVPTTVVSPWSRGGRVCSDVFDHTSTLLFLERRFGVEVPNLSQWRRDTCGDLTTALDFAGFDSSVPTLPGTAERAAAVLSGCHTLPAATPPTEQALPTTEGD